MNSRPVGDTFPTSRRANGSSRNASMNPPSAPIHDATRADQSDAPPTDERGDEGDAEDDVEHVHGAENLEAVGSELG